MQAQRRTAYRTVDVADLLLPEPAPRRRLAANTARDEIEDAVFEVVSTRSSVRHRVNDNPPRHKPPSAEVLPLTTRLAVGAVAILERQLLKLSAPAFSTLLVSAFVAVFWLCGGFSALSSDKMMPVASPSFAVAETRSAVEDANGMKLLSVAGRLTNVSDTPRPRPALRVISTDGKIEFGQISATAADMLRPADSIRFSGKFKLAGGKVGEIAIIPATD